MGFITSFLGKVAGEAVNQGAEKAKQKIAEKKAAIEAENAAKWMKAAFRLPKGYCEGANGKVWRVTDVKGDNVNLHIKVSGGKEYDQWFNLNSILDYYEDV